ncbi:GGDEF domain-containing phosphodiesterase [Marinomonas sp. C2222]|uniref:GGDEF domain-containing phosphodiesterase n=1 Tax=Marinomonas sargassi TaxID=2984494 RepID=A0ABT2YS81_9GAMM|nr:GGDEF domain-containing phosphodiesterase [Marinomonas sargassi]MCV2402620.1 GGDEF domain-containing phosphodiesterase [Marinomonas sargassi]
MKVNKLARKLLSIKNKKQFAHSSITDWIVPINQNNQTLWESGTTECTLKSNPNIHISSHRAYLAKHNHHALHLENTTQLKAIQEKLHNSQQTNSRLTHFDSLTKLPNLQNFCRQVNQRIEKNNHHLTGAMFIVHLCQFKLLNKQYGKKAANKVILEFSNTLQDTLSEQAIIGRLHGVKFACFVQLNQTHLIKKNLTTFIQSILPSQIKLDRNILNMDYQIGIAYFHTDGSEAEVLLDHCEMALENSSSSERFSYYNNDLENKLIEEHKLGLRLSEAIKNKELDMWLQPQVNSRGEICSFEALARWKLDGKFVSPLSFIKIAEDLGLLPVLSENFVISIVKTLSEWHKESIHIPIAFNLAGQELMNDSFFALLMTLINEKPWLSDLLELEITETSAVMTNPLIHKRLRSLSQYGFSIAIDDFGTGQASLGQLIDIPANILKIDRRFISPLPNDQRHIDIVKSTIQLAESLNMKVVAEGIETKEQANLLIALGCHTLQGYYFGKPSPMSDWTAKGNEKAKELRMVY